MEKVLEWGIYHLMNYVFDVVTVNLGMPFGQTKYQGIHDFEERFFVYPPEDDFLDVGIVGYNLHDLFRWKLT